jgi:hypothetical protein
MERATVRHANETKSAVLDGTMISTLVLKSVTGLLTK